MYSLSTIAASLVVCGKSLVLEFAAVSHQFRDGARFVTALRGDPSPLTELPVPRHGQNVPAMSEWTCGLCPRLSVICAVKQSNYIISQFNN